MAETTGNARSEADPAIWLEVRAERIRAHAKHGLTSMESAPADDPTGRRYRILVEEIGEVAQEFNDAEHDQRPVDLAALRKELIQVAAMAGAWADAIQVPEPAQHQCRCCYGTGVAWNANPYTLGGATGKCPACEGTGRCCGTPSTGVCDDCSHVLDG